MIRLFLNITIIFASAYSLTACSTNPATGEKQFTALMSPSQEIQISAQEHSKIINQYGIYNNKVLQSYISDIGEKIAQYTERPEIDYKFFLLDSPIVNAFALPGGYIYITRGTLALANSEAEIASVLSHEIAHVTARHSAERYSRNIVTSLGAMIISTAVGNSGISQALGIGSDLYIKSYSRGQETQADKLGIRYLTRAAYNPKAMAGFLKSLQINNELDAIINNKKQVNIAGGYFSTHPATIDRINKAISQANIYSSDINIDNRYKYLKMINGMTYGDSSAQGFIRGNNFYHPQIGFKFSVPKGYKIINQPSHVVASKQDGAIIIFDMVRNNGLLSPMSFLKNIWMQGENIYNAENININGMKAATASFQAIVKGKKTQIRLIVIKWSENKFARFQVVLPDNLSKEQIKDIKKSTYSFSRLNNKERLTIKPYKIKIITAKATDNIASLSKLMIQERHKEKYFRALNGLNDDEEIIANRLYKIVTN